MEGDQVADAVGHGDGGAFEGDGAGVERQAIKGRAEFTRKAFEFVERTFLLEGPCIAFEREGGVVDAGAAAGGFLGRDDVGR